MPIYGVLGVTGAPPGKALETLRAELADEMGMYAWGEADANADATKVIDVQRLARFAYDSELIGALVYILTDAGGAGADPEGRSRRITAYTAATKTITVEYAFPAAVTVSDVYELYIAPGMELPQWDQAINKAIGEAWPEVWSKRELLIEPTTDVETYFLPTTQGITEILDVYAAPRGDLDGWPMQRLVKNLDWVTYGEPGDAYTPIRLRLLHPLSVEHFSLYVDFKYRYPELNTRESSFLDFPYIMAAAKANVYATLGDMTHGEAKESGFLQKMNYWRGQAAERKQMLAAQLLGLPAVGVRK